MTKSRLFSGKIKKKTGTALDGSRYDYLDISQAEPDLGLPAVDESILVGDVDGSRTWVDIATYAEDFKGFTGSQGEIGYTGSQGEVGFVGSQGPQGNFGGVTFDYTFDSATSDADPGVGKLRLNNTAIASALQLYIHDTDDANANLDAYLTTIDDSTSQLKGHVRISNKADSNDFAIFSITGVSTNNTTYFTVPVAFVSGTATGFDNLEDIIVTFARTGDKGDIGFTGSKGDTGFIGSAGNDGIPGLQGDTGFTGSQGGIGFTGSAGTDGVIGVDGVDGETGFTGSQGELGYTGSAGFTGSQGDVGFTGSAGVDGVIGVDGAQGDIGYTGSQGDIGIIGFTGSQGVIGYTGSKGDIGLDPWAVITSNYTASNRNRLIANATAGSFNITLPETPTVGDYIQITDGANFELYPITILRNGNTIEGFSENVLLDLPGSTFEFIYDGATWQLTSTTGPQGFTGSAGAGFTGSKGDQGIPGEFAALGYTGSQGAGFTGSAGVDGAAGLQGDTGFTGSQGVGFTGSAGVSGAATLGELTDVDVTLAEVGQVLGYTGSNWVATAGGSGGGGGGADSYVKTYFWEGALQENVSTKRFYIHVASTLESIRINLGAAGQTQSTIQIKKNDVALNTIVIAANTTYQVETVNHALAINDYITVDITQSSSAANLYVTFVYRE